MSAAERFPGEYKGAAAAAAAMAAAQPIASASSASAAAAAAGAVLALDASDSRDEKDKRYDFGQIPNPDQKVDFVYKRDPTLRIELTRRQLSLSDVFANAVSLDPDMTAYDGHSLTPGAHRATAEWLILWNGERPPPIKKPLVSNVLSDSTSAKHAKWADDRWALTEQHPQKHRFLFADVAYGANQMGIRPLLQLLIAKAMCLVKGMKVGEVKRALHAEGPAHYDREMTLAAMSAAAAAGAEAENRKRNGDEKAMKRVRHNPSSSAAAAAAGTGADVESSDDDIKAGDRKDYKEPPRRVAAAAATSVPTKKQPPSSATGGSRPGRTSRTQ